MGKDLSEAQKLARTARRRRSRAEARAARRAQSFFDSKAEKVRRSAQGRSDCTRFSERWAHWLNDPRFQAWWKDVLDAAPKRWKFHMTMGYTIDPPPPVPSREVIEIDD
jgi:hypothetical protein